VGRVIFYFEPAKQNETVCISAVMGKIICEVNFVIHYKLMTCRSD